MISLEGSSKISSVLEETLIFWIRQHSAFANVVDISEIANGQFFVFLIKEIPDFKFNEPIFSQIGNDSLPAKISLIKNVVESVKQHYEKTVDGDISSFTINSVQLAMGNKEQIIKMITLLISIMVRSSGKESFLLNLMKMPQQHMEVFQIMIQNSLKLAEMRINSWASSPSSDRSKILTRMQELEDRVEELEQINRSLMEKILQQKQNGKAMKMGKEKEKAEWDKLLTKNFQLEEVVEKLEKEIKIAQIEKQTQKQKLIGVKNKYDGMIQALSTKLETEKSQNQSKKLLMEKISSLEDINQEIKRENGRLRTKIEYFEKELSQMKQAKGKDEETMMDLKRQMGEMEIKLEEAGIERKKQWKNESFKEEFCGDLQSSNAYRIRQNLGWFKNESGCIGNHSRIQNISEIRQLIQTNENLSQSIIFENKENDKSQANRILSPEKKYLKQQENKCEECLKLDQRYQEEIRILSSIILDLQENLYDERQWEGSSFYEMKKGRLQRYKQKLKRIFRKDD